MQKAVIAGDVVAFLEADKALDEAMALAADNPFAAGWPRPCRRIAAASGSATRPTPGWPRPPSIMSA